MTIRLPWGMDIQIRGLSVISSLTLAAVVVIAYSIWQHRDEEGDYTESVPLSTTSHLGMGDYYVIDIFIPLLGSG